jgi:hypothetical protein
VDVAHVRTEPTVEGLVGGGQAFEHRGEIICLDIHDGYIAIGRRLNPRGLTGDAVSLA